MMTEQDILRDYLAAKGLKKTQQRYDILNAFLDSESHISAYDLHTMLAKKRYGIGFSTVYRALKLFTECGIANEVNFGDGMARFEKAFKREQHGHLICTKCGRTIEFDTATISDTRTQIAAKHSFKAEDFRFEIYGQCRDCRE